MYTYKHLLPTGRKNIFIQKIRKCQIHMDTIGVALHNRKDI